MTTRTELPDSIEVVDGDGSRITLFVVCEGDTDEHDQPIDTGDCQACGEPVMAGYGTFLGAGGWVAWCVNCVDTVFGQR